MRPDEKGGETMNEVMLMGRLTADPKIGVSKGENPKKTADFTLAVKSSYKEKNGEYHTNFIFCTAYGQRAEFVEKYLKKGSFIALQGSLFTRNWEDDNGNRHFRMTTIAEKFYFTYETNKKSKDVETGDCGANESYLGEDFEKDDLPY